ncbi:hypothetical protein E2N91_26685 [Pseudomonas syringae pv. tomato]|nr:hypothetical protein E2N91_26685 [Pseudomonas syringae pv. tomato]TES77667.1 hypothetical protein E2N89_13190 [Pseudomonas syringae pv. tomato]
MAKCSTGDPRSQHNAVKRRVLGVNSVTNIDSDKGVWPAPIIRNASKFAKSLRLPADKRNRHRAAFCHHGHLTLRLGRNSAQTKPADKGLAGRGQGRISEVKKCSRALSPVCLKGEAMELNAAPGRT